MTKNKVVPRAQADVEKERSEFPSGDRPTRLMKLVAQRSFVSVGVAAAELKVSEMTIRRDLAKLEHQGKLARTHGGARSLRGPGLPSLHIVDHEEPAFEARMRQNLEGKERIAAAAVHLLEGCRTVALDVGTTTYCVARLMAETPRLRIFTSSLRAAVLLKSSSAEVYVPGGQVSGAEMSVGGPVALQQFEKLWFDLAFLGVSGVTPKGFFDYSMEDSELKRVYLRRAARKVVLCDSSKFNRMSLVEVAELKAADIFLTDAEPPPNVAVALARAGVELRIASTHGRSRALTSRNRVSGQRST